MKVFVFCGPSISSVEVKSILPDAITLPPASQGDIYRAAKDNASVIALIDGYFTHVPAVWHKEILWSMHNGVQVYGAASMGALRAAELHDFGMVGVGKVFHDFKTGVIEDDDEVAVLHGPPETGYAACSDAMVDIRATLSLAVERNVISIRRERTLVRNAKALHFTERSFRRMILHSRRPNWKGTQLQSWLKGNRISQKKEDAILLCDVIRQLGVISTIGGPIGTYEETLHWQRLMNSFS